MVLVKASLPRWSPTGVYAGHGGNLAQFSSTKIQCGYSAKKVTDFHAGCCLRALQRGWMYCPNWLENSTRPQDLIRVYRLCTEMDQPSVII